MRSVPLPLSAPQGGVQSQLFLVVFTFEKRSVVAIILLIAFSYVSTTLICSLSINDTKIKATYRRLLEAAQFHQFLVSFGLYTQLIKYIFKDTVVHANVTRNASQISHHVCPNVWVSSFFASFLAPEYL